MQRRTRNRICIWIIVGGLFNFLAYTILYAELGGDAKNGGYGRFVDEEGQVREGYYISGHFIHGPGGRNKGVSKPIWVYSYLHSITLWPTHGAIMIAMLILARPHIIATMRESNWIRGPTFITAAITIIGLLFSAITLWFTFAFIRDLLKTAG